MERAAAALEKVVAGKVSTIKTQTVGGKRALLASSIPARCNPGMSTRRFFERNPYVNLWVPEKKAFVRTPLAPDTMVTPKTDLKVNYTTTRLAAGPIPGTLT